MPSGIYPTNQNWSKERREKMSIKKKLYSPRYWLGKKLTEGTKNKISIARKGKTVRSQHWNWQGGVSATSAKRWVEKHRDRKNYLNEKRRALWLNAGGSHTFEEWETLRAQYNWTCPSCKKQEPRIILTEDHIIPLSRGGSNNIENIQPLCRSCNCKKHTKIIKYEN